MKQLFYTFTLLLIFLLSCTKLEDPLITIDIDDIITLSVDDGNATPIDSTFLYNVIADSNSIRIIKATLGPKTSAGQTIIFKTTHGVLTKVGEAPTSASGQNLSIEAEHREAVVQLNALNVPAEQVLVSGSVGNNTNVATLKFVAAYPNNFQINPLAIIGDTSEPIIIEVEAFRQTGVVSENIRFIVETTALDSIMLNHPQHVRLKNQRATFQIENVSKKAGSISVDISMPDTDSTVLHKSFIYIFE